ncbi:PAS domain S-box protein [Candidatus Thorarchaeota archaeon]|nr:MAG: PAS domain S-box protein [Candidatus Thorarchaeota archaeon]
MTRPTGNEYEEEWCQFFFQDAPVGLARSRLNTGEILDCNQRLVDIFGYSNKDEFMQSVKVSEFYVSLEERARILDELRQKQRISGIDLKLKRKNGQEFWGRFAAKLIPNENQLQIAIIDVTKEREIFEKLTESEQKYRALFESLGDAVFIHDLEGHFLEVNDVACERLGYSKEELLNLSPMDIDAEEFAPKVPGRIRELEEKGHVFYETVHIAKDGTRFPTELSSRAVNLGGETVIVTVARDISQRLETQRQLQEQKNFLEKVINSLNHPFFVIDVDTHEIQLTNEATRRQYGDVGNTCYEIAHGRIDPCAANDHICPLNEMRNSREHVAVEHTHITKSGDERIFEVHAHPIFNDSGYLTQMIEYSLDITDRKRAETERVRQQRELELYASLLKHDLSNDLQIIIGAIDIASGSIDEEDKELQELLETGVAAAKRMSYLLSVLGSPEEDADHNLIHILNRELEEAAEVHSNFSFELNPPDDKKEVRIRRSKLLPMVFENIFRNAAQHAGKKPHVQVDVTLQEELVHVDIIDNGPGIPKKLRNEIFQRKSSEKTGFGLYLAKEILRMLEGDITLLDSQEDAGAAFRVSLVLEK